VVTTVKRLKLNFVGASAVTIARSGHQSLEVLGMPRWKSQQMGASAATVARPVWKDAIAFWDSQVTSGHTPDWKSDRLFTAYNFQY